MNAKDVEAADDTMNPVELAELCEQRGEMYNMLARVYRAELDEEMVAKYVQARYPVSTGNALMDRGYYKIAKYFSNEWVDPVTKLSVDFLRTFMGSDVDTHSAAYPFESIYTSERRLLMQDARAEVLAIYRANGLSKSEIWNEGEDHIAVELEFMRIMNARAAKALRADDMELAFTCVNTQRNFLADHIIIWVPVFTFEMRKFSQTLFYQGAADLLEGFLQEEGSLLDDLADGEDD